MRTPVRLLVTALVAATLINGRSEAATTLRARLVATDPATSDQYGRSVAVDAGRVVVGSHLDDLPTATDTGSAYVYAFSGGAWTPEAQLFGDTGASDLFGRSAAIAGDTVVLGAIHDDHPGAPNAGSAYVFTRAGGAWSQQAMLTASDAGNSDQFGNSVAISGDTIIVGSMLDDWSGPGLDAGSAYVFVRNGTTWTQQARLTATPALGGARFGSSVSISGDTAVIGSPLDDPPGTTDGGSAYVFVRHGTTWTQQVRLVAADKASLDQFGTSVSINGDTVVVGSLLDDHTALTDAGSAYVFTRAVTTWTEQAKLTASDAAGGDNLGVSIALSGDRLVVGANLDDHPLVTNGGSAYQFLRTGTTWAEEVKLDNTETFPGDQAGVSVAISGLTTVVSSHLDDNEGGVDAGSAHVWVTDATPPETSITSAPAALTNQTDVEFGFSADEASTFSCTLDGDTAGCASPKRYNGLSAGPHRFEVVATDLAGNVDATPTVFDFTIDTTAPDTTIDSRPDPLESSSDATFTFSATEAATLRCTLDGASEACENSRTYTGLADGSHTFSVVATDLAGNTDPTPAEVTWTVDATGPAVSFNQQDGAVLVSVPGLEAKVSGTIADATGVTGLQVRFHDQLLSPGAVTAVEATLVCDSGARTCSWTAQPPAGIGLFRLEAYAVDALGTPSSTSGPSVLVVRAA